MSGQIRVLLGIQALQNPWSADRGIGRHVRELALALGRRHPELDLSFVTNREHPVPAATVEALAPYGPVLHADDPDLPRDAIYHIPSPFEPSAIERLWPPGLRYQLLVVTLHDLIPALFPDENMPDPAVRRAYWARAEIIRQADRVLSVSRATARDAVRLLAVRADKLSVTGGGVSTDFRPPESRTEARATLKGLRPMIDAEFVLYTGGMDYRKNVDGLLQAYAGLPEELRERYKLVLVGRLGPDDPRGRFGAQAEALGIADRIVFTGFVSDDELVLLYQAASLFVFPSLYEGFGLPVVEALACGAPALAGRNSSLVELVEQEEALFDAGDPASIREALARALTDEGLLERLRGPDIRDRFTWRRIAELTTAAYEEIAPRPRPPRRRRRRLLCVAPLPATGADGGTTQRVLEALADQCDVDVLVADAAEGESLPPGFHPVSAGSLERVERLRGGYDGTVYWLGNALDYAFPLHVLRSRPGIVVAYSVHLTSLYAAAAANRPDLEPRRFPDIMRALYPSRAAELDGAAALEEAEADRQGIYMAAEAIAHSTRFFVHFDAAVPLARLEAPTGHEWKIDRLRLPLPRPAASPGLRSGRPIALFTGAGGSREAERIVNELRELGAHVEAVGRSAFDPTGYSAAVAVRGALSTPGFTTFFAECVSAGLPTVLFGFSVGEPAESVVELGAEAFDGELRAALQQALNREPRPVDPGLATSSVEAVAERLLNELQSARSADARGYDLADASPH